MKLLGALGAWVGPVVIFDVAVWSAIAGGVMALGVVLVHRTTRTVARNVVRLFGHWFRAGVRPLPELTLERAAGPRLAYAVPVTIGLMVTLWAR